MDAVDRIADFQRIGQALAKEVDVKKHFCLFVRKENFWPPAE